MAIDEGLATLLREDLNNIDGIEVKRMFGGLAFLLHGHMVCGVHKNGGMFRVGKSRMELAMAVPDTGPMNFTGRPMGGMVDVDDDLMADDARRQKLVEMSLENARSLPPK